ncbi:MAG TPA: hypothetical protein VFE28_04605 [Candidatus Krumholzibacteria bacterium]|nr:hypothetical protein [Candidatus Krumholzibacteria bacterium]
MHRVAKKKQGLAGVAVWSAAALALWLGVAGCRSRSDELLVAYSGDCQAWIDPCG